MEVCVSKELIPSAAWVAAMSRREDQSGPLKALKENGLEGFPIRWIFRSQKNKEISSTMELVSFEKKSLPASLFEIPADYTKSEGTFALDVRGTGKGDERRAQGRDGEHDSRAAQAARRDT